MNTAIRKLLNLVDALINLKVLFSEFVEHLLYRWSLAAAGKHRPTAGWRSPQSCPVCCGTGGRGEASDALAAGGRKRSEEEGGEEEMAE